MGIQGVLSKWNDDRGFGFITPDQGGPDVFAHISAFPKNGERPFVGERLEFEIEIDPKGKKQAKNIARRNRPSVHVYIPSSDHQRTKKGRGPWLGIAIIVVIFLFLYANFDRIAGNTVNSTPTTEQSVLDSAGEAQLARAFANHQSGLLVSGRGTVIKILPDDNDGKRHQRFIVRLNGGQTLLIAHNIDLAGRVSGLSSGDTIQFRGQYEWNEKGGVVHWTHKDPRGVHLPGWLQYHGRTYQ